MSTLQLESNSGQIAEESLNQIFREARTHSVWTDRPVDPALLQEIYDLTKLGPTAINGGPGRFLFLTSDEAKARLLPAMMEGNVEKTRTAPVVAIVAQDTRFYDELPRLFPHMDLRAMFEGNEAMTNETTLRNSSLQGAYMILAARALGLDAGPMSGFDPEKVNQEFFPDGRYKVNFIVNLGYGDKSRLYPRLPRLEFEDAVQVL